MSKLSIIVPVFNKWNFTKSCLNDLSKLDKNIHEVIVVDNASIDQTNTEMVKNTDVVYIRNQENLGFAKACNIGFKAATGDVIMFLNNDIRVKSDYDNWTNEIITSCESEVLVGPTGGFVDPNNNFQFMYEVNNSNKPINYMSGWCLSALKETFQELVINNYNGPFSEEFGIAYFEDTDLSFRATEKGMKFKLVNIPVHHFGKITSGQINTHKLYSEARKIFVEKWSKK